ALGCPVLLLSATLPSDRRLTLLRAYAGEDVPVPEDQPYPRVTSVVVGSCPEVVHAPADPIRARTVRLNWVAADALPEQLRAALDRGGCAAVIRNTVGLAQATYSQFKDAFRVQIESGELSLELFHARFPFGRRQEIENGVLERYGRTN